MIKGMKRENTLFYPSIWGLTHCLFMYAVRFLSNSRLIFSSLSPLVKKKNVELVLICFSPSLTLFNLHFILFFCFAFFIRQVCIREKSIFCCYSVLFFPGSLFLLSSLSLQIGERGGTIPRQIHEETFFFPFITIPRPSFSSHSSFGQHTNANS